MNDQQMRNWFVNRHDDPVMVSGRDYVYHGWIVSVFMKRRERAGMRCVVEDKHGRLFIHNAIQLSESSEMRTGVKGAT